MHEEEMGVLLSLLDERGGLVSDREKCALAEIRLELYVGRIRSPLLHLLHICMHCLLYVNE